MKTTLALRHLTLLLLAFGFCTSLSAQQTPVGINGQLKVCGKQLCNQYDKPIQLRGMSTHGIQWYGWGNCLTESSLDVLADDWEADILRISLYVQEGGYVTDPEGFTNQVGRLIDEATERGMYALIDWHQLTPGDPNFNLDNAKRFFTDIAGRYKGQNNIIYDIANEPNGTRWDRIKAYGDQIIPVIRAIDGDAVILCGTHGYATFGVSGDGNLQDVLNNPFAFENVMYTFHFYAKSHREAYLDRLDRASDVLPVFVTEFGSQEFTGDGPNDFTLTQRFIDLMREKKISWTSWNYSDDFRSGAAWQTGTCSGGPWTVDRLKDAGRWIREKIKFPADDFPVGDTGGGGGSGGSAQFIEAEEYRWMNGIQTEPCTEGGLNVGYTDPGDWLAYGDIEFPVTGTYTIEYRVASAIGGGIIAPDLNAGSILLGEISVPNTGGWQNWTTITQRVFINRGTYAFGLFFRRRWLEP